MEDLGIITLYFNRDERAIEETEAAYGKLCVGIAKNILADEHEANECLNDTLLGLWNAIPPHRPKSLRAFAAKVARNLSLKRLDYHRASKRSFDTLLSLHELEQILPQGDHGTSPIDDELATKELGGWISEFLREQNLTARNVFLRKYWFFESVTQIAQRYDFSEAKVKSMLHHTRGKLRKYLTQKGVYV